MQSHMKEVTTMLKEDAPPRKVIIGTSMYAMYGGSNPYPGLKARLGELSELVDLMAERAREDYAGASLDLAVLPEVAVNGGLQGNAAEVSFSLKGPVLAAMGEVARRNGTYLVVPMFLAEEADEEAYSNAAVLLDRHGEVAGIYRKVHPVAARGSSDLEGGVTPGDDFPVFECDFGILGMQICFDVGFPTGWEVLGRKEAEIVAWPTQSPQTVLPSQYAFAHGYYVVSSTWRNNASLFAPTGLRAAWIEQPDRVLVSQIDLSYALLPWQPPLRNGKVLSEKYGDRVGYCYSEAEDGGIFWSNDPRTPIGEMVRELDLEGEGAAVERSRKCQDLVRGGQPSER